MKNPAMLIFILILSLTAASIVAQEVEDEREFDYIRGSERGPEHWGEIKREWAMCNQGNMQSPIDLFNPRVQIIPKSQRILSFYNPAMAILKNRGHDIEVKWNSEESQIEINGTNYILRQAHWHSPSEHTVNGRRLAAELHLVHQSSNNQIAVIGLFYEIGPPDPFLQKLMDKIESLSDSQEMEAGIINPAEIEMRGSFYYRYTGSLTTPPCTQGVLWTLNKQIASISEQQVAVLRDAVHDHARENARPLQPLNQRMVTLYDLNTPPGVNQR